MTDTERNQTLGQSRRARAIEKYRHRARRYHKSMRRTAGWRLRGVEALELRAGQTVVDVACGTGANFAAILERIGPQGELIGVDLSAEMLSVAETRAKQQLPGQVTLIGRGTAERQARTPGADQNLSDRCRWTFKPARRSRACRANQVSFGGL